MKVRATFLRFLVAAAVAAAGFNPAPALADDVIIQRDVTLRVGPSRRARIITYPAIGTRLDLLDGGARRSGYYHVQMPDGRRGWVYQTFVRRVPDAVAGEALLPATAAPAMVHYIDVDQGAATLLEFSCGAILIDAGGRGAAANDHLEEYLNAFFARRTDLAGRLDAIFVTHAHFDHDANLRRVADRFRPRHFVYNGARNPRIDRMIKEAANARPPVPVASISDQQFRSTGTSGYTDDKVDPLECEGVDPEIRLLSGGRPTNPGWTAAEFGNPNNHSLVIRVDYGEASFLFTGDLETAGIGDLVQRYQGSTLLDVDVFAVGHHGADNGTTEAMLSAMSPEIAVIPVGHPETVEVPMSAWDHGHPREAMLELLARAISRQRSPAVDMMVFGAQEGVPRPFRVNAAIYASSRDGDIIITAGADGILQVQTSR